MALIIRHEEEHIKQKHLWLNLLWDIIVAINWFNPLLYFARQQFRHDQELYCDYITLNDSDNESKKSYGHALLSTVSATHSVSLLCSWKMFNQLEERIMNLQTTSSLKSKIAMLVGATTILTASALYAATKPASKTTSTTSSSISTLSHVSVDGRNYVNDNGDMYMLENGQKRPMTEKEIAEYDDLMAESEKSFVNHDGANVPSASKPSMPRIRKAIPVDTVPPKYPDAAYKYNIEGFAEVKFQLDKSGSPSDIQILRSSPGDIFNEPTIQAIKQWRFKPAVSGKYYRYTLEYRLE